MDELELKKKIIEWLTLREESKALRKARIEGVHLQNIGSKPGVSEAGSTITLSNKAAKDRTRAKHQEVIEALKRMPKANLPKIDTISAKKSEAPPQSTAHVWDKSQQPRLTATGFLPKYKPQPKVQKPMAKATISPAMTSAPILVNRVDNNTPKQIDQPNIINPYKDIFSSLKNRKGK